MLLEKLGLGQLSSEKLRLVSGLLFQLTLNFKTNIIQQ